MKTRLLVLRSSQIVGAGFGHGDYIRKSISIPNRHQTIWGQVLKENVGLNRKRSSVIRMPNSKSHL
ncbi:hypothetical protein C1H46_015117 [Malus baccata]|uniref:Uncharacterized protein n=1 Tax=Malus baccata TaxID=106549 RepID=A0A540MKL0_MALBA|nr:hypothetical protein C1H46_015117 [Malus baccata]